MKHPKKQYNMRSKVLSSPQCVWGGSCSRWLGLQFRQAMGSVRRVGEGAGQPEVHDQCLWQRTEGPHTALQHTLWKVRYARGPCVIYLNNFFSSHNSSDLRHTIHIPHTHTRMDLWEFVTISSHAHILWSLSPFIFRCSWMHQQKPNW